MAKHLIAFFVSVFLLLPVSAQTSWNSPDEALQWLNGKVAGVRADVMKYNQIITADFSQSTACGFVQTVEQNGAVNSSTNLTFYVEHLNTAALKTEVKGKYIYLNLNTQDNLKLIKETRNGHTAGFLNSFRLYFDDLQVCRDAVEAFRYIKNNVAAPVPPLTTNEDAYAWLKTHITGCRFGGTEVLQSLDIQTDQSNKFVLTVTENGSRTTKKEYEFYLGDLRPENIRVNANGSRIIVNFVTTGDIKPVKYFVDGAQQNYTNKFELYTDDAQKAFQIRDVFIFLITGKLTENSQAAKPGVIEQVKSVFEKKETEGTNTINRSRETTAGVANSGNMVWLGMDFSKTKCIGEFSQGFGVAPANGTTLKNTYYPSWNMLVISEASKYDVKKMLANPNALIDIEAMQKHNATTPDENVMGFSDPNYTAEQIQGFVKEYSTTGNGLGACFVVESLNKTTNKASIHFVIIDLESKKVLVSEKLETKPGGMGIRNYWANAIAEAIGTVQKNWNKTWKAKYGL